MALFYIFKNLYVWFNGILVDFHICFGSNVTCSFLKTSLYTYKRMRVRKKQRSLLQKQFDFADILNKFHPQTTLLRTASVEVVMGIIYKMLWGAQWPDGSGAGGGGSEGLVGQILTMMHLYTIVYTAHLVYIILEVVDFEQRLNQEKNILNAWRINKECELLDRNPPSTCTRRKNDSYERITVWLLWWFHQFC